MHLHIRMRRQKERTRLAPQLKPGRCSESAMDYGVDFVVKKIYYLHIITHTMY